MIKFKSSTKASAKIPMASTADIIFLLLIFFMTVTVFKEFQGLKVELPAAKSTQKIEGRRKIVHIWIDAKNQINIDDMIVTTSQVKPIMYEKMAENRAYIVSLRCDKRAKYGYIAKVLENLKEAEALRVNFATKSL
ncbi:MAG: ExbD/TolR family protein [Candidatus Zixiibacteriota bacterium]